jgi:hypothetical protein
MEIKLKGNQIAASSFEMLAPSDATQTDVNSPIYIFTTSFLSGISSPGHRFPFFSPFQLLNKRKTYETSFLYHLLYRSYSKASVCASIVLLSMYFL